MPINERNANTGKGFLITKPEIWRATDNRRLLGIQLYGNQMEVVGIGMRLNSNYLADKDILPLTADYLHPLDLSASHCQPASQLSHRQGNSYIFFKPLNRNFHLKTALRI